MKNIKKFLGAGLISAMLVTLASFSAVTVAKYVESKSVGQVVSKSGVEYTSIFFNPNIWTSGTDSSGNVVESVYYMWIITEDVLLAPTRHINKTVSNSDGSNPVLMDLYVYEYKYEWKVSTRGIIFLRCDPSQTITNFKTFPSEGVWNRTNDILYSYFLGHSNAYNYICISGWTNSGGGYSNSGYTTNRINKNASTGALTWL